MWLVCVLGRVDGRHPPAVRRVEQVEIFVRATSGEDELIAEKDRGTASMVADLPMVLFVCHANLCRSPMAERLTRHVLDGGPDVATVVSAGTEAVAGRPMHRTAAQVLRELGAEPDGFASQPLTETLLARAALVLTAERRQRAFCVSMHPPAMRRTFTIRQLGRLAGLISAAKPAGAELAHTPALGGPKPVESMLSQLPAARARLQPVPAAAEDIADPVRGSIDQFRTCALEIRRALRPVLALLAQR